MMGRPSKLSPALAQQIIDRMTAGVTGEVAAQSVGVSRTAFYAWKARGERESRGRFRDFADAVKRAEAHVEIACAAVIRQATPTNWQAAAWMLERRHPERWARRDTIRVEREVIAAAIAEACGLDAAELVRDAERILREERGD